MRLETLTFDTMFEENVILMALENVSVERARHFDLNA